VSIGEFLVAQREAEVPALTFVRERYRLELFLGVRLLQQVDETDHTLKLETCASQETWRTYELY
jgi:hypothetical protein